jgi:hypothetical protein
MAIDFDAIRRKLGQLSGQNKKSVVTWRPEEGKDYQIRVIAYPDNEGQPFVDRWYYYNIGGEKARPILAPNQFGKKDPIQELISKLREDGSDSARDLVKKLYPKLRTTAAVIVRGEEDKGVRLWTFGKMIYQDLLKIMLDEDYGDITDLKNGRDIKVSVTKQPGKSYPDTKVSPRVTQSPLSKDPDQIEKWLSNVPRMSDYDDHLSVEEIEKQVNDWLASSAEKSDDKSEDRYEEKSEDKRASSKPIDDEIAEMRSSKKTTPSKKKANDFDDLDNAFAELEG